MYLFSFNTATLPRREARAFGRGTLHVFAFRIFLSPLLLSLCIYFRSTRPRSLAGGLGLSAEERSTFSRSKFLSAFYCCSYVIIFIQYGHAPSPGGLGLSVGERSTFSRSEFFSALYCCPYVFIFIQYGLNILDVFSGGTDYFQT